MVYAKKLIVLTGVGGKGTVTLERSAAGLELRLTTYNLPDLGRGNYVLAVFSDRTRIFELGRLGRMNVRVNVDADMRIDGIHFAVAECGADIRIRLYGTNAAAPLWEGNMTDIIRRKVRPEPATALPEYSGRRLEDYFYDIFPSDGKYRDNAVASVNFYAPGFAGEPPADDAPAGAPVAAADEVDPSAGMCADEQDRQARPDTDTPSELERRYILHLMSFAAGAQSPAAPPERQAVRPQSADAPAVPAAEPAGNTGETERARGRAEEPPRRTQLKKTAAARDIPRAGSAGAAHLRKASFYEQAAPQIDKLFRDNPHHAELEKLLPDTRWVRVDFDGKSYYAVGLIGARPDFVGYAVPAAYTPEPPEELDGYAVWVPRDPAGPAGDGYWVMYQDAVTGASVKNDPGRG